jgi:phosphate transport system protein
MSAPTAPTEGFSKRTARLQADLVEQGRRVQSMLEGAFESLFEHNPQRATAVVAQDDVIDAADVEIEKACVVLLTEATRQSAELEPHHLRQVLTIAKVNNELERVADVAVDLAELAQQVSSSTNGAAVPDTFRVMANSVIGILRDVNTAVLRNDAALANIVLQSQHAVTAFKSAILRDAEEKIARGQMTVDVAFRLHEIASQCEIIADHCTNIAEQVIYITTGKIVRHMQNSWVEVSRPKAG